MSFASLSYTGLEPFFIDSKNSSVATPASETSSLETVSSRRESYELSGGFHGAGPMGLDLSGIPIGSAIGGWLVTHSSSGALIVAAIVSVMSAALAFLMIPRTQV